MGYGIPNGFLGEIHGKNKNIKKIMAEEERFELSNGYPSTVFKTVAFSHSATPPQRAEL